MAHQTYRGTCHPPDPPTPEPMSSVEKRTLSKGLEIEGWLWVQRRFGGASGPLPPETSGPKGGRPTSHIGAEGCYDGRRRGRPWPDGPQANETIDLVRPKETRRSSIARAHQTPPCPPGPHGAEKKLDGLTGWTDNT